jgi:hypothetical protein
LTRQRSRAPFAALAALTVALAVGSDASAQWSAPSFLPPRPGDDVGVYLSTFENFGVQGIWRQHGNLNLGVRAGWIDSPDRGGVVAAFETWGLLVEAGQGLPADLAWTLGAGAVFDGGTSLEVPAGISVGRGLRVGPALAQVYAHPRFALIVRTGAEDEDETTVGGLFDLGAEVALDQRLKIRAAATLGSFDALGIGLALRFGRAVEVR